MGLQSLYLKESQIEEIEHDKELVTKSFWQRQFQVKLTNKQKIFDWVFGVILPVICFVADPFLFKGYGLGKGALLGTIKPFAYLLSFILVMTLSANLIWGEKLKLLKPFLSGLFAVGAVISFAIGIILLPFSFLGLMMLIGVLGFTPLFSGFVYLRNSVLCFNPANLDFRKQSLVGAFVLSAVLSITVPMLINVEIQRSLVAMKNGDVNTIHENEKRLKYVSPLVNFDALGGHYCASPNSDEHKALAEIYEKYTGEDIQRIDFHICEDW